MELKPHKGRCQQCSRPMIQCKITTYATYWQSGLSQWLIISISSVGPVGPRLWTFTKLTRAAFDPQPPEPAAGWIMSEGRQWPDNDPSPKASCCHNIHTNTLCLLEMLISKFQKHLFFYLSEFSLVHLGSTLPVNLKPVVKTKVGPLAVLCFVCPNVP